MRPSSGFGLPPLDDRYQSGYCSNGFEYQLDYLVGGRLFVLFLCHTFVLLSVYIIPYPAGFVNRFLKNFLKIFNFFHRKKPQISPGLCVSFCAPLLVLFRASVRIRTRFSRRTERAVSASHPGHPPFGAVGFLGGEGRGLPFFYSLS